jgi:hypothetical protein
MARSLHPAFSIVPACGAGELLRVKGHVLALAREVAHGHADGSDLEQLLGPGQLVARGEVRVRVISGDLPYSNRGPLRLEKAWPAPVTQPIPTKAAGSSA